MSHYRREEITEIKKEIDIIELGKKCWELELEIGSFKNEHLPPGIEIPDDVPELTEKDEKKSAASNSLKRKVEAIDPETGNDDKEGEDDDEQDDEDSP